MTVTAEPARVKSGVELIAEERETHDAKGFDAKHDDQHGVGELCLVAALLATWEKLYTFDESANGLHFTDPWPWTDYDPRPFNGNVVQHNRSLGHAERIKQLAVAGSLIAAEIDILQRIPAKEFDRYRTPSGILEE